MNNVLVCDLTW